MAGRERWLMPIMVWTQVISALTLAAFAAATLVQQTIDADYRGRVVALSLATTMGTPALGAFGIGWLAEGIGFQGALMVAAALSMVLMIITGRRVYRARSGPVEQTVP